MSSSTFTTEPEDKKTELTKNELFTINPEIDPSVFNEENIEIDPHSLKLLKDGNIDQRYAVIGYIDTDDNKLYLYFRPSFPEIKTEDSFIETDEAILKINAPGIEKFKKEDRVFAPPDVSGMVHNETIASITAQSYYLNRTYDSNDQPLRTSPLPGIKSKFKLGLSFFKRSENNLDWSSRSTQNQTTFSVNPIARMCYYFSSTQTDFRKPRYYNANHMDRTAQPEAFEKIINSVRNKLLKEQGLTTDSTLQQEWKTLVETTLEQQKREGFSEWEKIRLNKSEIAKRMMRTIYFASGMKENPHAFSPISNNEIIEEAINIAKENNIPLDLNYIPESAEYNYNRTALMQAILEKDLSSVKLLLSYDSSISVLIKKDVNNQSALDLAMENRKVDTPDILQDEIISALIENLLKTQEGSIAAFQSSFKSNHTELAQKIFERAKNTVSVVNTLFDYFINTILKEIEKIKEFKGIFPDLYKDFIQRTYEEKNNNISVNEASMAGNIQVMSLLLDEQEKKIDEMQFKSNCLFIKAILENDMEKVNMYVSKVDINISNHIGETPLHIAALTGNDIIVDLLCKSGADVKAITKEGLNYTDYLIKYLLTTDNIVSLTTLEAIQKKYNISSEKYYPIVEKRFIKNMQLNDTFDFSTFIEYKNKYPHIFNQQSLELPNQEIIQLGEFAKIYVSNTEIFQFLVKDMFLDNKNKKFKESDILPYIDILGKDGHYNYVHKILMKNAITNLNELDGSISNTLCNSFKYFLSTTKSHKIKKIMDFKKSFPDIFIKITDDKTYLPLIKDSVSNDFSTVSFEEISAYKEIFPSIFNDSIHAQNCFNETTLMLAAKRKDGFEIVKLLLENKVDATIMDDDNNTALSIAAKEKHYDIVKLLIAYDNNTKITPIILKHMMDFIKKGQLEELKKLKSELPEIFLTILNEQNKLLSETALEHKNSEIIRFLESNIGLNEKNILVQQGLLKDLRKDHKTNVLIHSQFKKPQPREKRILHDHPKFKYKH